MTKLTEFVKMKQEIDEKIRKEGLDIVKNGLKELFDKYPQVAGIRWNGWAPHFNDGEPCVFGLRHLYITLDRENWYDFENYGYKEYGDIDDCEELSKNQELMDDLNELWDAFNKIDDFFAWQFDHEFEATAFRDKDDIEIGYAPDHD